MSLKVEDEAFGKLEPKQKREKTFEALRDLLIRGTRDRPLVLAMEDLQWIDKTTEEFLTYMIGWLPRTRILLLLLYRPEYVHQWGSKSYYSMIGVGHLSTGASAELVGAILEGGEVVPELQELILTRAAGNPLFMEELTQSLLQNGSIRKTGDRFVLTRDIASSQVPDTVQGIIAARMDRLEESLKRIMQVAAVIGREFAFRILETITEMKENLKSGLAEPPGAGIHLREEPVPRPGVHLPARPGSGGRLQQPAYPTPEGDSREDRPGHRAALSGETGRVLRDAGLSLFEERESGPGL